MKYRKKPVVVDAFRLGYEREPEWFTDNDAFYNCRTHLERENNGGLIIHTKEGAIRAKIGDYIIRGIKGEIYPCDCLIFAMTYERVVEND